MTDSDFAIIAVMVMLYEKNERPEQLDFLVAVEKELDRREKNG